eukprot:6682232-Alexandrium_andersonii.AAC.1
MSASLVGSEMCIRDRRRQSGGSGGRRAPRRGREQPAVRAAARITRLRTCLLYTSDAADDM